MKTVKRKAEVGERILSSSGLSGVVDEVDERHAYFWVGSDRWRGSHEHYEVIIEDEPNTDSLPPHSAHYHQNGLDPLEVMRRTFPPEQYEGFLRGSLLKYTMRYDRKGQEAEDLEKAEFYSEELKRWKEETE